MPTLTPTYSLILQQKASSLTPGLCPHLVFTCFAPVLVHQIHPPLLVHFPPPPRPCILLRPPRPLTPLTPVFLTPRVLTLRPPILHNLFGPPSMAPVTIVVNGVTNGVIVMPPPEVLVSERVLVFPLSLDPLLLIALTFT